MQQRRDSRSVGCLCSSLARRLERPLRALESAGRCTTTESGIEHPTGAVVLALDTPATSLRRTTIEPHCASATLSTFIDGSHGGEQETAASRTSHASHSRFSSPPRIRTALTAGLRNSPPAFGRLSCRPSSLLASPLFAHRQLRLMKSAPQTKLVAHTAATASQSDSHRCCARSLRSAPLRARERARVECRGTSRHSSLLWRR